MKIALKIVSIIGLIFWTICCFFGMFFAFNGNYVIAIPLTLLVGVALFLSYLLMLKMQDKSATQGNRDRARTIGFIMLGVYVVATICSAYYINHIVKTMECKDEVRAKVSPALDELALTFDMVCDENNCTSDKIGSYLNWVSAAAASYAMHLEAEGTSGNVDSQVANFRDRLLGTETGSESDFYSLAKTVNGEIVSIKNIVVDRWWLPTLYDRLNELQTKKKSDWESKVVEFSEKDEFAKTDYPYQLKSENNFSDTELTDFLTQDNFKVSGTAILIMVALQVLILLGYLLGLKTGGKNDKIVTDEHGSTRSWSSR